MRSVGTIPHPKFRIEVYSQEHYFYIEIEAGPMKQCYKFTKDQASNLGAVQAIMDEAFLTQCYTLFEDMYKAQKAALERASV
jgi:hypothetical protein